MKGKAKRIICLCLTAVIAVTTAGYAPSPLQTEENMVETATPSEAESPGDKSTPSEAESPGGKQTPSEAVKKFVQVAPEEVPDYYSQVKKAGKQFWKYEDRNGMVQYRDYGYVNGDAEFPLWYETDLSGNVEDVTSSINLDEEYYDLAPYLYVSVWPEKADWEILSNNIFGDDETISKYTKDMKDYQNWNKSDYTIWKIEPIQPDDYENILDIGTGYYFFGVIKNAERGGTVKNWFAADQNGTVLFNKNRIMTMLDLAPSNYITVSYSAPGTLWSTDTRSSVYSDTYTAPSAANKSPYRDYDRVVRDKLGYSDYKLIGWVTGSVSIPKLSVKDTKGTNTVSVYGNPADVSRYVGETTLYKPGFDINIAYSSYDFKITGVWCSTSYYDMAIFYKEDFPTYADNDYERKPHKIQAIISTANTPVDISRVGKPTKPGYTFQCWRTFNTTSLQFHDYYDGDTYYGDDTYPVQYYAVYEANENTVRFLDMAGNLIEEKKVLSGASITAPMPPQIPGKRFKSWDKNFTNITSDLTITAQYEDVATVTIVGNGGFIDGHETYTQEVKAGSYLHDLTRSLKSQVSREGYSTDPDKWYYFDEDESKSNVYYKRVTDNMTVYVDWKINSYKVTFRNIYSDPEETKTLSVEYGTLFKDLSVPSFTNPYKYSDYDGIYTNYMNGILVPPDTPITKDVTYYAKWKTAAADVTWHDCFKGQEKIYKSTINIGSSPTPALWGIPELTRNGYQKVYITKWYTEPDGQGEAISNDLLFEHRTLDVYSYWQPMKYYIYCYQNLLSNPYAYKYITHLYDTDDVELPVQEPPSGKVFIGYSTKMEGGTVYKKIDELPYGDNSSLSIYAQYANATNTVTFKDWNGTVLTKRTVSYGEDAELPEVPKRSGYRFIGWDKSYKNIQADMILTAQYEVSSKCLTLNGNGGSISGEQMLKMDFTAGDSLDQALTEGKAGAARNYYTFAGWYTEASGGSEYPEIGNKMPDKDLNIYAHWVRNSSEVVFKDWKGSVLDKQEVAIEGDAVPPAVPERSGYTFTGWDKPTTNIQDHVEITALYSINGYLLTLDGTGGTLEGVPKKEVVISFDQSFDQVLKDGRGQVTRPGYHFDGWYNSASGGSSYSYSGNQMPSINVTVYAHWSPNTYEVTFDPDHVRWTVKKQKEDHTFDTELGTLPAPEIYGWKFNGWWTEKNGSGTKITKHSMVEPGDAVYYGCWEPVTYEVRFVSKAEQLAGESVQTFTINQKYDQEFGSLPIPEEKGYTFNGWYDADHKKINPHTIFRPDSVAEGYTYYAEWKSNSYKIRFVYTDGDGKQKIVEIDRDYFMQLGTLLLPEKSGYTFAGWFNESGEKVTSVSWVEAGNVEYKGKWNANQYTIHFKSNSESIRDAEDKTVTYALPIGDLPILYETGYAFLGWYTKPEGGIRIKETTLAALGDQTYYGHWSIKWINNGNGTYKRPGADGRWNTADDEHWRYGPDGEIGTKDDYEIYIIPGGTGTYIDNGDGTYITPGADGSWTNPEYWSSGPDGEIGTSDDKRIDSGNLDSEPTNPEPTNPEPMKQESEDREEEELITVSTTPIIESTAKPEVPDNGGTFNVNPNDPLEVTYTKADGTTAKDEWVGDGKDWYHVDETGKLNYDWYLEGDKTWYKLNKEPGDRFGAALSGWNYELMDDKRYFFDPATTKMLTGWQLIDNKWYYFTKQNESQTYFGSNPSGSNPNGWKYDKTKPGKPYGSMYQNERTPDGYLVDENGVWKNN